MSSDTYEPTGQRPDHDGRRRGGNAHAGPPHPPSDRTAPYEAATPAVPAVAHGGPISPAARGRVHALDVALLASRARYYAGDDTPDPALETAVCAVVHALRTEGWPVLAVLRAVKVRLAAQDGPAGGLPHAVATSAVRWCIAHYYDPGTPPASDRRA